jgi:uncharacterized membrane protein YgcG
MASHSVLRKASVAIAGVVIMLNSGCLAPWKYRTHYVAQLPCAAPPPPLGTMTVHPFFQKQEENGEASDFVVYEHEFAGDTNRLNAAGEDHLRQIAARLADVPYSVIVEQSTMASRNETKHKFPVHNDPQLDLQRREVVARALALMGAGDADSRVVVGPALTPGYRQFEATQAYNQGIIGGGVFGGGGGLGGGGGGGFGGGGGGGFGGAGGGIF